MKVMTMRNSNNALSKLNYPTIKQMIMTYPKPDQQLNSEEEDILKGAIQLSLSNIIRLEESSHLFHDDLQAIIGRLKQHTEALYSLVNPLPSNQQQNNKRIQPSVKNPPTPWTNLSR